MANTIPCPNPTCTHQFKPAELQSATQLSCPKCGFRIQGKAPPKAAPGPKAAPIEVPIPAKPAPAAKAAPVAVSVPAKPESPPLAKPVAQPAAESPTVATAPPPEDGALFNPN